MQSHSKQTKNTRTTPPITRQSSKTRTLTQTTIQGRKKTPPPLIRTSTPTEASTSEASNSQFLYENPTQPNNQKQKLITLISYSQKDQTMATAPSESETNLLDNVMDVDPLSDSVTHINLSGILNKSVQPEGQKETSVDDRLTQTANFIDIRGKRLKAALTIIAKASHHKAFMETCLMRNSPPRNMSLWVQPHIYHSNPDVEKQWKDTLHQASLDLTTTLIEHYTKVIRAEQETLDKIKQEMTEYLTRLNGTTREEEIKKWKEQSKNAEEEARKLGDSLKENREAKLFRKRKRTDSQPNLIPSTSKQVPLPTPKQPHLQQNPPADFMEALTGLINTYSKNGPQQQRQYQQYTYQPQLQQPNRGKGPANGKGFPRKGAPQDGH